MIVFSNLLEGLEELEGDIDLGRQGTRLRCGKRGAGYEEWMGVTFAD